MRLRRAHRRRRPGRARARARARRGRALRRARRSRRRGDARTAAGRRRLGRARLRDQPRQRGVPARAGRVAGAAARAHRAGRVDARRGRRRRARSTSPPTSWASARSPGSSRSARCARRSSRVVRAAGVDGASRPARSSRCRVGPDARRAALRRRQRRLPARLVVGADGLRSWVREAAGIAAAPKPYGQTAVVANFACERAHRGRACQWFRGDGGILAWLPLPGRRISIVWSAPDALARELLALRAGSAGRARRRRAAGTRSARSSRSRRPPAFPLQLHEAAGGRRPSRWRWSATPRTASIRSPGRASTSASATPRRWPPCCASADPWPTPARRCCWSAMRAGGRSRCCAMQTVTDGSPGCSGSTSPWIRPLRNSAGRRRSAARAPSGCSRNPRCARLSIATPSLETPMSSTFTMSVRRAGDRCSPLRRGALLRRPCAAQPRADGRTAPLAGEAAQVKKLLEQKFPGATVGSVDQEPYFGLYEVQFDDQLVYTDAKVTYVLVGSVYDADTKKNLTEARLRKLNRVAFDSLPLDLAIKKVKGNGERKLAVFSDADCPFCARLEKELKSVDNVTIYTFLYPDRPAAPGRRAQVADDLVRAGQGEGLGRVLRVRRAARQQRRLRQPVAATGAARAEDARSRRRRRWSSPTASIVPGALPAQRLEAEIKQAEAEAEAARRGEEVTQPRAAGAATATEGAIAMAIIDFLKKQFIDIIEWTDDSRDTLSYRFPDEDKEIKNGAQLIVRESQVGAVRLPGRVRRHVRSGQAHAHHRQHPDPHQPQELEVRAREPVQGRRLLRRHARVHRQQVGHGQSGDDARRRLRHRAPARLRHLRFPHRRREEIPEGGRRHRRPFPPRRIQRHDALADRQRVLRRAGRARRSRRSTSRRATPSWARRCCRSSIRRSARSTASR